MLTHALNRTHQDHKKGLRQIMHAAIHTVYYNVQNICTVSKQHNGQCTTEQQDSTLHIVLPQHRVFFGDEVGRLCDGSHLKLKSGD